MAIRESLVKDETVYVSGHDLTDAVHKSTNPYYHFDTAQEAYDAVGYFEKQEETWEVFEFETRTRIRRVEPPYTPR